MNSGSIYYLCKRKHAYALGVWLATYDNAIRPHVRIIPYEDLASIGEFAPGAFIFTDFERLSEAEKTIADALRDAILSQEGKLPLLNDSGRVLLRFELLRTLYEAGLNRFNVYRLDERDRIQKYPVFIRRDRGYTEPVTGLLDDRTALEAAVATLPPEAADDPYMMIVEFGNAPAEDGRYKKYAAFRVGDVIYPQHLFSSTDWYIRFAGPEFSEQEIEAHLAYLDTNPHEQALRKIFEIAGIDYGRIDYCIVDGAIQTFEINTNPTVIQQPPYWDRENDYSNFAVMHNDAMSALLNPEDGPAITLPDRFRDKAAARSSPQQINAHVLKSVRRLCLRRAFKKRLRDMFSLAGKRTS